MATLFSTLGAALGATIEAVVRWVVLPVTGVIPVLVRTGLLFLLFAAMWAAFGAALVLRPAALDETWAWLTAFPLPVQALAWLLFLPLTAGLWVWAADWPVVLRVVVVLGLGAWNLLVFLPRRDGGPVPSVAADTATPTAA